MSDMVNHPDHYISESGMEMIYVIEAFTKDISDPFEAYCTGNIIKYICRWPNKNGVEDLEKARWYLDKLILREKLLTKNLKTYLEGVEKIIDNVNEGFDSYDKSEAVGEDES